jgi:TetR/AcrR family transcriptional regulator, lmrAB and yxaGH operons repressor
MPRTTDTRKRLLDATAELFRRQGYTGTGLKQIVGHGAAPWGSLYHFFPGGKEQLAAEAIERSGRRYQRLLQMVLAGADPPSGIRDFFRLSAQALEASGYADGCPIATVALETANRTDTLRQACANVFQSWLATIIVALTDWGVQPAQAGQLATHALATYEGATLLSRTLRTTSPLTASGELTAQAVAAAPRQPPANT